jgi:heme-degrading monooxygenase HmoA
MFAAIFEYRVDPERAATFETTYGPSGEWAELFGRAEGYLGTDVWRDDFTPGRYLLLDRWESAAAYEEFRRAWATEYAALSEACAPLYQEETAVGRFTGSAGSLRH